jgi:hypothetical protein
MAHSESAADLAIGRATSRDAGRQRFCHAQEPELLEQSQ